MDIDPVSLRSQCDHFRILVIGRANAGKTTLLKQVCQSIVDPEILDPDGNKLDPKLVEGSDSRGLHDINNQLIFKSNPGYIFHDSRGFESGSLEETNKVKSFIAMRAGIGALSEQLHAIWYCLPTDTTRPLLKADEHFFGTDVTGKVPVIAILTKCDAIDDEAFQALLIETGDLPDQALVDLRVREMLDRRFVGPLKRMPYHPADYAEVMNMQEDGDFHDLIMKTASALTDHVLRLLFVSVQQNNIDLCIRYAVEGNISTDDRKLDSIVRGTLAWFPHIWRIKENYDARRTTTAAFNTNIEHAVAILNQDYPQMIGNLHARSRLAVLIAALCICAEQTFSQGFAQRETFTAAFSQAFHAYLSSPKKSQVESAIATLPLQDYERLKDLEVALVNIITTHQLRIPVEEAQFSMLN